jgi:hypothetical protein
VTQKLHLECSATPNEQSFTLIYISGISASKVYFSKTEFGDVTKVAMICIALHTFLFFFQSTLPLNIFLLKIVRKEIFFFHGFLKQLETKIW